MQEIRHSLTVRLTHWLTTFCFFALLLSGVEILISHPRFYWGETGNVNMTPLFTLPIPASRGTVPTGYGYVLPDQNGWSRALHFEAAWALFFTALAYLGHGLRRRHFARNFVGGAAAYRGLQGKTYLVVIFGLFPLMIWTGLAMSPGFTAVFPIAVESLGGQQTARTLHFAATLALVLFVLGHVLMVVRHGFAALVGGMITGSPTRKESAT